MKQLASVVPVLGLLLIAPVAPAAAQDLVWGLQTGTPGGDQGWDVAADGAGYTSLAGGTGGKLGEAYAGGGDAFLARYDAAGAGLWVSQLGTPDHDVATGVAVDSAGNTYIAGYTSGNLGGANAGGYDMFLAKYDPSGAQLWVIQSGTSKHDYGSGVAADSAGNALVVGNTTGKLFGPSAGGADYFLAKYDESGELIWAIQAGTSQDDEVTGVAVDDAGNAHIVGATWGSLGGPNAGGWDPFLARHDASGGLLWAIQFGTSEYDFGKGVAVDDAGNALVVGYTNGSLFGPSAGSADCFLTKYDASGVPLWAIQTGTPTTDRGFAVAVDGAGNASFTGETLGSLFGPKTGERDAFLARSSWSGALLGGVQFGTAGNDSGQAVSLDGEGNAFIIGTTSGELFGENAGNEDFFLAMFGPSDCYPDFTGDGELDLFDFLGYVNTFNAGDDGADCDGNGPLDLFDFLCFVNKFNVGC